MEIWDKENIIIASLRPDIVRYGGQMAYSGWDQLANALDHARHQKQCDRLSSIWNRYGVYSYTLWPDSLELGHFRHLSIVLISLPSFKLSLYRLQWRQLSRTSPPSSLRGNRTTALPMTRVPSPRRLPTSAGAPLLALSSGPSSDSFFSSGSSDHAALALACVQRLQ